MYAIIVINNKIFVDNQKKVILDFDNKSEIPQILRDEYSLILLPQEPLQILDDFVVISAKSDLESSISTLEFSDALQMIKKCCDIRIREQARRFLEDRSYKKNSKILLAFGIRDNHVVCINDITENERGEKCNCYCPACEMPLLARLGNGKKTRHFAHKGDSCSLEIAQIVGTLILIKEIMDEGVSFTLPPIKCKFYEIYDQYTKLHKSDNRFHYYWNYIAQYLGRNDNYVEVYKSVPIDPESTTVIKDTKKPKIIFNFKNRQCAIVIKTSSKKIKTSQKDNNENSSVLEIDLRGINLNNISKAELKKVIIGIENKQWLINKQKGKYIKKQVAEIKKGYDKWVTENPPQNSRSFMNESITMPMTDTNISRTKVRKYTCSKCNEVYDENLFSIRGGTQENICRYCANPNLKK